VGFPHVRVAHCQVPFERRAILTDSPFFMCEGSASQHCARQLALINERLSISPLPMSVIKILLEISKRLLRLPGKKESNMKI
jgi:hypothetical protein